MLKKNAVIFHANGQDRKDPISVIRADTLPGGGTDCDVPLLAVYDGTHYSSVYPATGKDCQLTKLMVEKINNFQGDDFKKFFKQFTMEHKSGIEQVVPIICSENENIRKGKASSIAICKPGNNNCKDKISHESIVYVSTQTFDDDTFEQKEMLNNVQNLTEEGCSGKTAIEVQEKYFSKFKKCRSRRQSDTAFRKKSAKEKQTKTSKKRTEDEELFKNQTKVEKERKRNKNRKDTEDLFNKQKEEKQIQRSNRRNKDVKMFAKETLEEKENKKMKKDKDVFKKQKFQQYNLMKTSLERCYKCLKTHTPYAKFCKWAMKKWVSGTNSKAPMVIDENNKRLIEKRITEIEKLKAAHFQDTDMYNIKAKVQTYVEATCGNDQESESQKESSSQKRLVVSILSKFRRFSKILLCIMISYIIPSVFGSDDLMMGYTPSNYHYEYAMIAILASLMIILIVFSIFIFVNDCCCGKRTNEKDLQDVEMSTSKSNHIRKLQTESKMENHSTSFNIHDEMNQDGNLFSTDDHPVPEDLAESPDLFNYYSIDITRELDKIADCNHQAVFIKFDQSENIDQVFLLNKSLQLVQKIDNKDVEKLIYSTENCDSCPIQRNLGTGKTNQNKSKITSMKISDNDNTKCSLISIVLSLFNMESVKSALYLINKKFTLCNIGTCDFCLIVNLFVRYQTSKRTIKSTELEGLDVYKSVDETSIDLTYLRLMKSIETSCKSNHPDFFKVIKHIFENNILVDKHATCNPQPEVRYNLLENHSKTCQAKVGIDTLCICGNVYTSQIHWSKKEVDKNRFIVIYERNPKESRLKKHLEIDHELLQMSSYINYTGDHFTCCIPDFEEDNVYSLEEKVITKKLHDQNTPVICIYESITEESRKRELVAKLYNNQQILKIRTAEYQEEKKRKKSEYDKSMNSDPEKKRKKSEYNKSMNSDPEKKRKKSEYNKRMSSDPEKKREKSEYDKRVNSDPKRNFLATKRAIQKHIGLTIICNICSKLKCPDSVKTYKSIDLIPMEYRILMSVSDTTPAVCYYCKQLLSKGKVPETNEITNCLKENRFMNNTKLQDLINLTKDMFTENILEFGKIRANAWNGPFNKQKFEHVISKLDDVESINIQVLTKKYSMKKKIEYCLGYLSLSNLIRILVKIKRDKILNDGEISEEGSIILTKYYFDQLFEEEKDLFLETNRHLDKTMTFGNIANLRTMNSEFQDYIHICQNILPNIYEETDRVLENMNEGMVHLQSGSKLVNHLLKLTIPFQRLIHLPRGYSYKIKGPSILVPSSVSKTISQLLPQPISDILIPVALKRKLVYQSDYIFEHINTGNVLDMFKLLKFTFQNMHFQNVHFSQELLEEDIKEFVKHCKKNAEDVTENHKEKDKDDNVSSTDDEGEIEVEDVRVDESLKEKDSKITDDSILIPFGRPSEVGSSLVDALACQIEKRGLFSKKRLKTKGQKARKKYMKKLNIAPAEGNIPQNWLEDKFLEEKAFPHLFPSGIFTYHQVLVSKFESVKFLLFFFLQEKEDIFPPLSHRV